jgi:hypothetical protein
MFVFDYSNWSEKHALFARLITPNLGLTKLGFAGKMGRICQLAGEQILIYSIYMALPLWVSKDN